MMKYPLGCTNGRKFCSFIELFKIDTVHHRLFEKFGTKFRHNGSDKLNIRIIEDVNVSKKIKTKGRIKPIL